MSPPYPDLDEWHQTMLDVGYIFCRPCGEYHRPCGAGIDGECTIDENGVSALDAAEQQW